MTMEHGQKQGRTDDSSSKWLDDSTLARHLRRRMKVLETERKKGWESHWRDIAFNFMPRRSRFLDAGERTNDGDVKNLLEDGVGIGALRTLASGMQSGLTSPARPWFSLTLQDEPLTQFQPVKEWLHECYERMVNAFARSNFYDQIHMLYRELGSFGTGVMFVEEDSETNVRCRTETAGTYCIDVDASGRVDTLYRRIRMTPRQIAEAWPDTCPSRIRTMANNDSGEWLTLLHAVEPNPQYREGGKNGRVRKWRSVFMLLEGGTEILEVGGYYEFPALCPRWDTTVADIYGTSPAMDALGDCRQLQKITQDGRLALELEVSPPLLVAESAGIDDVDMSPRALNFTSSLAQGQPSVTSLYQVKANMQALEMTKAQLKQQIKEMLFNDLFLMITQVNRQMTATEVAERNSEKMLLLGPVLDRLRSELFQPLIERVWGILERAGVLPLPPVEMVPQLAGQEIKVEFISILAMAQKQAGIAAINQTVAFVAQLAQITQSPDALDKLDTDEAIDMVAEMQGTPPKMIRSNEDVAALREQRQQQMQQMQQMQMAQQGAQVAASGAGAMKDFAGAIQAQQAEGGENVVQ
ncbi:head-tail connector protein [Desulfovibrio sp. OttesenSCG-928-G15]|nr:head-tail connector protein [Desulfovibrio sp. OttesenSCG-928-G15]